jgi:uncharacterized repeat protein (TIGR03803 family)
MMTGCGGGDGGSSSPLTILYAFGSRPTDALGPGGSLLQASDGNLYGVTFGGGINGTPYDPGFYFTGNGTVFKITPEGEETVLHEFANAPADGNGPQVLIQGNDGNFYGTTWTGGANGHGIVFRLTLAGVETILYTFGALSDGKSYPAGGLVRADDGTLYGNVTDGTTGPDASGAIFKLTPDGMFSLLYDFQAGEDGSVPSGNLLLGSDGNIYGITISGGGPRNCGTVFKLTPAGVETVLHSFLGGAADGTFNQSFSAPYPQSSWLIQGSDGNLYGTTPLGGAGNMGTVFKLTPAGVETVIWSGPSSGVVQGNDGNLYGTDTGIFQLTTAGAYTTVYLLPQSYDPSTALVQASDGSFYGASYYGGVNSGGLVFKFIPH